MSVMVTPRQKSSLLFRIEATCYSAKPIHVQGPRAGCLIPTDVKNRNSHLWAETLATNAKITFYRNIHQPRDFAMALNFLSSVTFDLGRTTKASRTTLPSSKGFYVF